MTGQLQYYGKIGLTNAGYVSQLRVNGDVLLGSDTGCKNKNTKGVEEIFHEISEYMRLSLVKMCIEDFPSVRTDDQLAMSTQQTFKRRN